MNEVHNNCLNFDDEKALMSIADKMRNSGLPEDFILSGLRIARVLSGTFHMFKAWNEAESEEHKNDAIEDIQDSIDDYFK